MGKPSCIYDLSLSVMPHFILYNQLSDAMEAMLLSVLSPILQCEWNLETWEEAFISSVSNIYII